MFWVIGYLENGIEFYLASRIILIRLQNIQFKTAFIQVLIENIMLVY